MGKRWKKVEEYLPYFRNIFWNNGKFNIVVDNDDNTHIYSSVDGNDWYSFKYDFVKNYSILSCFKEYGILFTLQNDDIYLSSNLKSAKKIKNPFYSSDWCEFFILKNMFIISNNSKGTFAYWNFN